MSMNKTHHKTEFVLVPWLVFCLLSTDALASAHGLTEESIKFSCLKPPTTTQQQRDHLQAYCNSLTKTVLNHWHPPFCEGGNKVVAFTIAAKGDISDVRLERSSGVGMCDKAALDAVIKSAPLSELPPGVQQIRVHINFDGTWKQNGKSSVLSQPSAVTPGESKTTAE